MTTECPWAGVQGAIPKKRVQLIPFEAILKAPEARTPSGGQLAHNAVAGRFRPSLSDGRAKPDDVAVGIDHRALVLSPFSVLWQVHVNARRLPLSGERVRIFYE